MLFGYPCNVLCVAIKKTLLCFSNAATVFIGALEITKLTQAVKKNTTSPGQNIVLRSLLGKIFSLMTCGFVLRRAHHSHHSKYIFGTGLH